MIDGRKAHTPLSASPAFCFNPPLERTAGFCRPVARLPVIFFLPTTHAPVWLFRFLLPSKVFIFPQGNWVRGRHTDLCIDVLTDRLPAISFHAGTSPLVSRRVASRRVASLFVSLVRSGTVSSRETRSLRGTPSSSLLTEGRSGTNRRCSEKRKRKRKRKDVKGSRPLV